MRLAKFGAVCVATLVSMAASAEPLKIGLLESLSGSQTTSAENVTRAARYVFDEINAAGGINGAPVEIKIYEPTRSVDEAVARLDQMLAEGTHVVLTVASSNVTARVSDEIRARNAANPRKAALLFNVYAESLDLTGDKCHFHHFRFMTTAPMRVNAMVAAMKASGDLGTRAYTLNPNYSWGTDVQDAAIAAGPRGGYEVVGKDLHGINKIAETDYLGRMRALNPSVVFTGSFNDDLLLPIRAAAEAKLPVKFAATFLDQPGNVGKLGNAAIGHYVAHPFNIDADKSGFTEQFRAKVGQYPVYIEPQTVFALRALADAVKKNDFARGAIDMNKVAYALEDTAIETPIGQLRVRKEDHQVVMPVVVSRVEAGARYPVDGTNLGFKAVSIVPGDQAIYPVQDSCQMARPAR